MNPQAVLAAMIDASRHTNYRGSVAFDRDGQLATFRVDSRNSTEMQQALVGLNVPLQGAISRECQPDTELLAHELSEYYNLYLPGSAYAAGRAADELLLLPLESSRYGYSFLVDQQSNLQLRTLVLTPQRDVIERFEFVDIVIDDVATQDTSPTCGSVEVAPSEWSSNAAPLGFKLVNERWEDTQIGEESRLVLLFSDGLASITMLMEPTQNIDFPTVTSNLGATNLLLSHLEYEGRLFRTTLVGEVPLASLETMMLGITKVASEEPSP